MKCFVLIILLISGVSVSAGAQSVHYTLSGGFIYPEFSYQSNSSSGIRGIEQHPHTLTSFNINMGIAFPLSSHFSLRTSFGYQRSVFKLSYRYSYSFPPGLLPAIVFPSSGISRYTFSFLQINSILKYTPINELGIYVFWGPKLNYLLHAKGQETGYLTDDLSRPMWHRSLNRPMYRFNLSMEGGIGYEFRFFKTVKPYIEATYNFGLTRLDKPGHKQQFHQTLSQNDWKQRAILIKLGIAI